MVSFAPLSPETLEDRRRYLDDHLAQVACLDCLAVVGVRKHIPTISGEGEELEAMMAAVSFSDTGKGIAPEDLNRIFDFYYSKKEHGTGIGLSLVAEFARLMGGKAWVQDAPSGGASFHVLVPERAAPSSDD